MLTEIFSHTVLSPFQLNTGYEGIPLFKTEKSQTACLPTSLIQQYSPIPGNLIFFCSFHRCHSIRASTKAHLSFKTSTSIITSVTKDSCNKIMSRSHYLSLMVWKARKNRKIEKENRKVHQGLKCSGSNTEMRHKRQSAKNSNFPPSTSFLCPASLS